MSPTKQIKRKINSDLYYKMRCVIYLEYFKIHHAKAGMITESSRLQSVLIRQLKVLTLTQNDHIEEL